MREDLLDARASLEWAETQIPSVQQEFMDWKDANPYRIVREPHPDGTCDVVAVVCDRPLPLICNAWIGAIINSLRSSLDLVAAALARRNGGDPAKDKTYFPINRAQSAFEHGIQNVKWLSEADKELIRSFKPYQEGDQFLWRLHHLDIVRKHRRLIVARPQVVAFVERGGKKTRIGGAGNVERLADKTILFRIEPGDNLEMTDSNLQIVTRLMFDDVEAGMAKWEVPLALRKFSERVADVLATTDALSQYGH